MTRVFRPYRLINSQERQFLQKTLEQALVTWNTDYALYQLSCRIEKSAKPTTGDQTVFWSDDGNQPLVLCTDADYSLISYGLFGEMDTAYAPVCESFFQILLQQLSGSNRPLLQNALTRQQQTEWFYPGAPFLALTLMAGDCSKTLYWHPQWVLSRLPATKLSHRPLTALTDALDDQILAGHVELAPFSLPLSTLLNLQRGNVIKTDHPLSEPLWLKTNHQTLCQVDLGKTESCKSILIKS